MQTAFECFVPSSFLSQPIYEKQSRLLASDKKNLFFVYIWLVSPFAFFVDDRLPYFYFKK